MAEGKKNVKSPFASMPPPGSFDSGNAKRKQISTENIIIIESV